MTRYVLEATKRQERIIFLPGALAVSAHRLSTLFTRENRPLTPQRGVSVGILKHLHSSLQARRTREVAHPSAVGCGRVAEAAVARSSHKPMSQVRCE